MLIFSVETWLTGFIPSFFAGYAFTKLLSLFLEPKCGRGYQVAAYVMNLITICMVIQIGDAFNILATLPLFFFSILICYRASFIARLSIAMILFSITMSVNAIFYSIVERYLVNCAQFARLLFWLVLFLLFQRLLPYTHPVLSVRMWISFDALTFAPFATTIICVLLGGYQSAEQYDMSLIIIFFTLFSGICVLSTVAIFTRQEHLEREQQLWYERQQYYKNLEQQQLQVRRLRHDMANHLQVMAGLENSSMRDYLNTLIASPALDVTRRFCENDVVNAVLSSKWMIIKDTKIEAEIRIVLPTLKTIADTDLCAIFANALDNAIEACQKLPENKRWLTLNARAEKGLLMLHMENSTPATPPGRYGFFTTKADTVNHGFGLAGIREITQRHHGSLEIQQENDMFTLLLSLPIQN